MCTRNELDMILRKIAEVYRSVYGDELVSIFLYGSYARGDYQSDSDIDVAAIVRGDRRSLQDKLKKVVSPTVIPYEEYEKYKNDLPYYKNIAREGVKISA